MAKFTINRNKDACVGCNECFVVCPQSSEDNPNSVVFMSKTRGEPPEVKNTDNCIQCFNCVDHCRCSAITFDNAYEVEILIKDESLLKEIRKII
jgi:formate hydrogenlyase subunit 6/NADH:ubiquinone oxidoreductase subunit I